MAVITISREVGSFGTEISQRLAKSLNYAFIDKEIIGQVLKQYGLLKFHEVYEKEPSIWSQFDAEDKQHIKMLNRTILAFAKQDNTVLLGRGGFVLLHPYPNVLNIRIQAPFAYRVQQIKKMETIHDDDEAEAFIRERDQIRRGFLQTFYDVKWEETTLLNLVIDTSRIPIDMAVKWILEAARALEAQELDPKTTTQSIEVDEVLAKTVAQIQD